MTLITALTLIFKERRDLLLQKLTRSRIKKPWMQYREIMIISEILRRKKPSKCLEWGSGNSTGYFPKYLGKNASWIAVEHNKEWYDKNKNKMIRPGTIINYVPPNNFPWTDTYQDGAYSDLKDYIEFPKHLNTKFDFVLIDGQARKDCLLCALDILDEDGIVVLHNANREYYHESFRFYKHKLLFTGNDGHSGLWIGSTNLNLETVLDIKKYEKVWQTLNTLSRVKKRILPMKFSGPLLSKN